MRIPPRSSSASPRRWRSRPDMRIARWRRDTDIGEGFVIDDRVVPFPDNLSVAEVVARGLAAASRPSRRCSPGTRSSARRRAAARADRSRRDPRLRRLRGARRGRERLGRRQERGRARVVPGADVLLHEPPHRPRPRRRGLTAPHRQARLRTGDRGHRRGSRRGEPHTRRGGCRDLRIHDHERLVGTRPAIARDEGAARPGERQGLRHQSRPLDRDGGRAGTVIGMPRGSSRSARRSM